MLKEGKWNASSAQNLCRIRNHLNERAYAHPEKTCRELAGVTYRGTGQATNQKPPSAVLQWLGNCNHIARDWRSRLDRKHAQTAQRLERQCHGGGALRTQPEVCRLSLRGFVQLARGLIYRRNRNRRDFELKEPAFSKRSQRPPATRIGALGNHSEQ